jgi:Lipid A 3-O-deacylase (PagL)
LTQWIGRSICGLVLATLATGPAHAGVPAPHAAGVLVLNRDLARGSTVTHDYEQREVYLAWPFHWTRPVGPFWRARAELVVTAGTISEGDHFLTASIGPTILLATAADRLVLNGGLRPTYVSNDDPGPLDLGIHLQFTSHIGILLRLWRGLYVGWRLQHISNAGLAHSNPGINPSTAEIRVAW